MSHFLLGRRNIRFLYTDECTINAENVTGLLYTSRKYDVETLFTQSTAFLEESLCEENLCEILEKSHSYGETDLEQKALKLLSQAGSQVIKSAGFLDLCFVCFETFLKTANVNINEETVFEPAMSWTKAECDREGLSHSHENIRKVLSEMVYEIRFASLSLDYLAKVVGPSGLLTGDERVKIMDRILGSGNDISPFKLDTRGIKNKVKQTTSPGVYYTERFSKIRQPSRQGSRHAISFSTNKNISLLGLQLYGLGNNEIIKLDIQLSGEDGHLISHPVNNAPVILDKIINDKMFRDPVSIKAGHVYTLSATFPIYSYLYSGSGGASKLNVGGVEFTFVRPAMSWFKVSIEDGQIPGLIWRY